MALATIGSVLLSTVIAVKFLSPIIQSLAVAPFYYSAMRRRMYHTASALVVRWAIVLFVSMMVIGVFVPSRFGRSVAFGRETAGAVEAWVTAGSQSPPADLPYLLWGGVAFIVASLASGGLLGLVGGATALGAAVYGALFLFKNGDNVIQVALIAVPVWQWCFFGACAALLVPMGTIVTQRLHRNESLEEDRGALRRYMYYGGGLFLVSLLLRLSVAGWWLALATRWTTL